MGFSFRVFLKQLFFHLLGLLLLVILVISIFLFYFPLLTRPAFILSLFFTIFLVHQLLKNSLLIRHQWSMMTGFAGYLADPNNFVSPARERKSDSILSAEEIRSELRHSRFLFREWGVVTVSRKMCWSFTTLKHTVFRDFVLDQILAKRMRVITWKLFVLKALAFLVLLMPFILVSILFTLGLRSELKLVIVLLGLAFVYFLNAAIIEPVFYLSVQKKFFQCLSQSSQGI